MRPFRADRHGGGVHARFEAAEVEVLRRFAAEAVSRAEQAAAEGAGAATAESDPALARLLPDAYPDDAQASAEFRRFTAERIAERKADNARAVIDSLGDTAGESVEVRLDDAQAQAWLRTLTDIRLVLAAGLGIEHDGDEGDVHDLESATRRAVYDWLAAVQEFLVHALTRASRR
ncbi:DUF2017 domain-containing protein [Leifsonia shinshuensis]|uniref:DUF2017 domain-containing protein n=1 Tax=Leifsonia shinshuensis TaxID=150026 RepID=UPI001F507C03|nr:DUF2017 domain-containing protein [Leifsonia shinshuensis]MCI0155132.1 DUF2017 domain-containing protein [Leifsonia shinshuensis]